MITDRKIDTWTSPVSSEADRPNRSAADMKAIFDANSNQLKSALNGLIDDLGDGAAAMAFTQAAARANIATGDSLATILGKLAKFYADAQTAVNTVAIDALHPDRYLSADGSYSVPSVGEAANGLPQGGTAGQVPVKVTAGDYDCGWKTMTAADVGAVQTSEKGASNGVATLDGNGKVSAGQASSAMIQINTDTALDASYCGKTVLVTAASVTIALPADLPAGTEIEFIGSSGTASFTLTGATFDTSAGQKTSVASVGSYPAVVVKRLFSESNIWIAKGDI